MRNAVLDMTLRELARVCKESERCAACPIDRIPRSALLCPFLEALADDLHGEPDKQAERATEANELVFELRYWQEHSHCKGELCRRAADKIEELERQKDIRAKG